MREFLTVKEVATRYNVHVNTIWSWAREGRDKFPKPIKLGARVTRWRLADLEEWEIRRKKAH